MPMQRILVYSNVFLSWPMAACASDTEFGDFRIPFILFGVEVRKRPD